jgi:hypothetical protein
MNQIYTGRFYLSGIVFDQWHFFYQNFELQGSFRKFVPSKSLNINLNDLRCLISECLPHLLSVYSTTCSVAYAYCDFLNITN